MNGAAIGLNRRTGPIGRKRASRRRVVEAAGPVADLTCEHARFDGLMLPGREVAILDGQFFQGRCPTLVERFVELPELLVKDVDRPAVGDDVVHGQEECALLGGQSDQLGAKQWAIRQIEWLSGFLSGQAYRLGGARG